jgi:hypothetical protein
MNDILEILPFVSLGLACGALAVPPAWEQLRLSLYKRGGLWFWRIGRLGGSVYVSARR